MQPIQARLARRYDMTNSNCYLTTKELAVRIGLKAGTLDTWRSRGKGPPFVRIGRTIRYDARAVDAWISAQAVEPAAERSGDVEGTGR